MFCVGCEKGKNMGNGLREKLVSNLRNAEGKGHIGWFSASINNGMSIYNRLLVDLVEVSTEEIHIHNNEGLYMSFNMNWFDHSETYLDEEDNEVVYFEKEINGDQKLSLEIGLYQEGVNKI